VKPSIEVWRSSISSVRKEFLLARFRIGHNRLTRGPLLRGDPAPLCVRLPSHIYISSARHVARHHQRCLRYGIQRRGFSSLYKGSQAYLTAFSFNPSLSRYRLVAVLNSLVTYEQPVLLAVGY
jgi:hypothetical protein